jgi:ABC-type transporter Mla MlaB component
VSKAETLVLPEVADAAAATRLWRELAGTTPSAIDFTRVREIDSAGLALVAELCRRGLSPDGPSRQPVQLLAVPPRFRQLCAAHRIEEELLG